MIAQDFESEGHFNSAINYHMQVYFTVQNLVISND